MQTKNKILKIIKWIYLAVIMIFVFGFIFIITYQWCLYVLLGFLIVVLSLYLTIHILRMKIYLYTFPKCHYEFQISFLKDITSYNAGIDAKVLVCPKCALKEVMKSKPRK